MVAWLGAADEDGAVGGWLDGIGVVRDGAGDDGGLAAVADTGATGPADRYVARFSELEQAAGIRGSRQRRGCCG